MESAAMSWLSFLVASFALFVSLVTLWLTHIRLGSIKMTRPSQIYFGPDGGPSKSGKVFIHTLLYATSFRGRHLEDLYVEVMKSQTSDVFPIWVHGDGEKLKRGSGLFIGREGVSVAHHFLKSEDNEPFKFQEGKYKLNVFAKVAGANAPRLLHSVELNIGQLSPLNFKTESLTYILIGAQGHKTTLQKLTPRVETLIGAQ